MKTLTRTAGLFAALSLASATFAIVPAVGLAARAPGETVMGWGADNLAQLGDGTTTDTRQPVFAQLPAKLRYTTVRTSEGTSVALATSGAVFAWGYNSYGQVGDGTTTMRMTPVRVRLPAGLKVAAVRESGLFTLALTTKGQVLDWGNNTYGELGDGTTQNRATPVRARLPKGVRVTAISAGDDSALALTSSGRVLSWGANFSGQLGDGGTTERQVPGYVRLPAHTKITSIAAGVGTGYAVNSAGRLLAWGNNYSGELGDGTTKTRLTPVQVRLPAGVKVVAATGGLRHALALTTGGRVLAWGYNAFGQLGNGSTTDNYLPGWAELPHGTRVRGLAAGREYSMALTTSGRVLAWGRNEVGQLGNGSTTNSATPVRVHLPAGFTPTAIGAGSDAESGLAIGHPAGAAVRAAAGPGETVVGWGADSDGQLGDGTVNDISPPVYAKLPDRLRYTTVRVALSSSVALATSGAVFASGDNAYGQLGDGTTMPSQTPVRAKLPKDIRVTAVREGLQFTLALTSKGQLLAWGDNNSGQLGDGTGVNQDLPVRVRLPKGVTVTAISAGQDSALALTKSGRVLSWGGNLVGQLGTGTRSSFRLVPGYVRIPAHTKITSVAAGNGTGFAVTSAGRLLSWGYNSSGQLGDGTTKTRRAPAQVHLPTGVKVAAVSAGGIHVLALTTDGRVLGWGDNFYGQLANATVGAEHTPVLLKLGTKVRALAAGMWFSLALTTSGRILAWGRNELGQLGDGTTTNRATPERVHLPAGFTPTAIGAGSEADSALAIGHQVRDGRAAAAATQPGETVLAWGNNLFGELGDGTTTSSGVPVIVKLPRGYHYTTVRCVQSCLAVTTSGRLFAWGRNDHGQLGDGSRTDRHKPVAVRLPAGVRIKAARAGNSFTLALTTTGRVLAWGWNYAGQLGDGTTRDRLLPTVVRLPRGVTVTSISAGDNSPMALTTTGRVLSWGGNHYGQLGDGTTRDRHVPGYVRLPRHTTITSIAAGSAMGYAVTAAGRVLSWGINDHGQVGDGTTRERRTPVAIRLPRGVKVVAAAPAGLDVLVLTADGRALGWGYNQFGQLGDATTTDRHRPVWVRLPNGVKLGELAVGGTSSLALTSGHRILAWGDNQSGQLGTGSTDPVSLTPVLVQVPPGFVATGIGAGYAADGALAIGHLPLS
jgi:alpha-tubulin suppressor-like RCC1 family protein